MAESYKPYPYAYFQGQIIPIEKAQISIMTNALHYGIGIFGGIKVTRTPEGMAVFRLQQHVQRLKNSVDSLGFSFDLDVEKTKNIILELAGKNKLETTTYIRPLIYRSDTLLSPDIKGDYSLVVYMLRMSNYFDEEKGLKVCISSWQRNSSKAIPPKTKATGGYINSALAINEAHELGYDSAIMLDKKGNVCEGAVMNIFLVKDGQLITPSTEDDILEGINRRTVIELAKELGIKVQQRHIKKQELFGADEVFFTGTAANITWCKSIDKAQISSKPGEVTTKLSGAFKNLSSTHPQYFTKINQ